MYETCLLNLLFIDFSKIQLHKKVRETLSKYDKCMTNTLTSKYYKYVTSTNN